MTKVPSRDEPSLRIHQAVARDLGVAIVSGRYQPGDSFIGEIEYAEQLQVSRTAYREAIRILTAKGLLESRPKAGTRVTPRTRWNLLDPDILAWMFAGEPDEAFIRDLFELRAIIEPAAAALAAERRSDAQLEDLGAALEAMQRHGLATEEGRAADQQFHRVLLQASHNEPLATLASSVGAAVEWTTRFKQRRRPLPRDPVPSHKAVYQAIAARKPKAAEGAMADLLRMALEDMDMAYRRVDLATRATRAGRARTKKP